MRYVYPSQELGTQHANEPVYRGLTLREYFAGQMLSSVCCLPDYYRMSAESIARMVWEQADAMLAESLDEGPNVRRIPAWEPKDGEAVFAKNRDGSASVAKCTGATSSFIVIKLQNGATGGLVREHIKPFDPDKIGKPWDEI